jgi:hypothetical protein
MKKWVEKFLSKLKIEPSISGLEISDSVLNFARIDNGEIFNVALRLPPQILEGGNIKDRDAFRSALLDLHSKITPNKKENVYIIATIPEQNIYLRVFNLPFVAADNLEEAVCLNLEMLSPMDYKDVYSDWQKIGETEVDGGQLEILGVFAPKQMIDSLTDALRSAYFVVVAMEVPVLALIRLLDKAVLTQDLNSTILFRITSMGLGFSIIRHGNIYFNHFVPWEATQVSWKTFSNTILRETQKIINFYASRWSGALSSFIIFAPNAEVEKRVGKLIADSFSLQVLSFKDLLGRGLDKNIPLKSGNSSKLFDFQSDVLVALGSALRGFIERGADTIISIAALGTEDYYRQSRILLFVRVWRNVFWTVGVFVLVLFLAVDFFFNSTIHFLENNLANIRNITTEKEWQDLTKKAEEFNKNLALALEAKKYVRDWTPLIKKIEDLAGPAIILQSIQIQAEVNSITLKASAFNEEGIIKFKKSLENDNSFTAINLPLSSIVKGSGNSLNFEISFKLKN